ncbi:MAG: DUF4156 domain-containing protein [Pseudomonadota bacterium]
MNKRLVVPLLGTLFLSACNFVKLAPNAADVLVLKPYQARECEQLRRTTSQVMSKVWFVSRNEDSMAEELTILAKNTAVEIGGNAVVPDSAIAEGKQRFIIYNCPHMR